VLFVDLHLLHDGTPVEIREIRADDGERLQASHARLSPESRYRRFLSAKPTLSEADARYLVEIDGCGHYALVATSSVDGHQGEIIAVARFVALPETPRTAEFAIVVGDAYQRQGLASGLMDRLAAAAVARGIERFRAVMLSDNLAIQRLLERLAVGDVQTDLRGEVTEMEIGLAAREARKSGRCGLGLRTLTSSRRAVEADRPLRPARWKEHSRGPRSRADRARGRRA
jgi:RimJ/RimL family protein N-acetyltransferase